MVIDEKVQILFNLLIDTLCLSISLRMVCSGGIGFDAREPIEFVTEEGLVLAASVADEFARFPVKFEDVVTEKSSHA